ncbi:hypothetical protein E2C01_097754 [Portunus trituberculatus]|uniref:Uncharacterized protein n=1 Tax=Portunus trituberculatus TaxID=210409 RepID=A0A5B7K587_PORTR|nr:hypothetical protein [Portunus trituberculatus]
MCGVDVVVVVVAVVSRLPRVVPDYQGGVTQGWCGGREGVRGEVECACECVKEPLLRGILFNGTLPWCGKGACMLQEPVELHKDRCNHTRQAH